MDYQTFMACCAILFIIFEGFQFFMDYERMAIPEELSDEGMVVSNAGCTLALIMLVYTVWSIIGVFYFWFNIWFLMLFFLNTIQTFLEKKFPKDKRKITKLDAAASIVVLLIIVLNGFNGTL